MINLQNNVVKHSACFKGVKELKITEINTPSSLLDSYTKSSDVNVKLPQYMQWVNPENRSASTDAVLSVHHMNDNHAKYKKMSKISTAFKTLAEKLKGATIDKVKVGTLRVHSGDYANGGHENGLKFQVNLLNDIGINYSTIGNHELDLGTKVLASALQDANFRTLSSNMMIPEKSKLGELTTGINPKIAKSHIVEIEGKNYGIIGVSPPDLPNLTFKKVSNKFYGTDLLPGNSFEEENQPSLQTRREAALESVRSEVKKLTSTKINGKKINKIILVSHVGVEFDEEIAKKVSGIDIILGGHSHSLITPFKPFEDTETVVNSPAGEPVMIFQSGANAKNFTVADVAFDKDGILKKTIARVETANNFDNNPKSDKIIQDYIKKTYGKSEIIANIKEDVENTTAKGEVVSKNRENPFLNYAAESVRKYTDSEINLFPGFTLRDDVEAGDFTDVDVKSVLALCDHPSKRIIKRNLTGKQIIEALERGLDGFPKTANRPGYPGLVHSDGLRYTFVKELDKDGKINRARIKDVQVLQKDGSFEPLKQNKTYSVSYETILADGIEKFTSLMEEKGKEGDILFARYSGKQIENPEEFIADKKAENKIEDFLTYHVAPGNRTEKAYFIRDGENGDNCYMVTPNGERLETVTYCDIVTDALKKETEPLEFKTDGRVKIEETKSFNVLKGNNKGKHYKAS